MVALVGVGRMPAEGEDECKEARLFYVGTTRATQRVVDWDEKGGEVCKSLHSLIDSISKGAPVMAA